MLNLSTIPPGSTLGKLIRMPLRLIPDSAELRVLQGPLRGARWIAGSSNHGCWLGFFEPEKQKLLAASLNSGDVFYDIGSHVGFFSILGSRCVGPGGQVYAFEPAPHNVDKLRRHIAINNARNIGVFAAAVSDTAGEAFFDFGPSTSMGKLSASGDARVETITLDAHIEQRGLRPPTCIKIDVEGAEAAVLRGAKRTLARARPRLFVATHGRQVHQETIEELHRQGYEVRDLFGGSIETTDELVCD